MMIKRIKPLLALALGVALCLLPGPARGQQADDGVQFVSTNGNDANNGLTWSTAKATIQAAINALPQPGGGRVTVGQGDYYLTSGITTDADNIEIDCVGGRASVASTESYSGSVRIQVPSGAVGFTFNPSGSSTNYQGPVIKGCSFIAQSGAVGGIHLIRTNDFTIDRVSCDGFSGSAHYGLYLDGTGDYTQYGVVTNSTITNSNVGIELNRPAGIRLIGDTLIGDTGGGVLSGTIGIWQTGGAGGNTMVSDSVIEQFDTLVKMDRCNQDQLVGDKYEVFITAAIVFDASTGQCIGPQVIGGGISNYLNGSEGTGIVIESGVNRAMVVISGIENVATEISNSGTNSYITNN